MKLTGYILMMEDGSMKYTTTDKTNKEPEFNGKKSKGQEGKGYSSDFILH